jgi:hypothetical protein
VIGAWRWGKYLGPEALEQGVDVRVSSWNRMAPNTFPALAKATGNYMNSILIRQEAAIDGYSEGIALDVNGYVSEGSGENIFVIRDGKIFTPPLGSSILGGITRASIITIAKEFGYEIIKYHSREMLYIADEVFFTAPQPGSPILSTGSVGRPARTDRRANQKGPSPPAEKSPDHIRAHARSRAHSGVAQAGCRYVDASENNAACFIRDSDARRPRDGRRLDVDQSNDSFSLFVSRCRPATASGLPTDGCGAHRARASPRAKRRISAGDTADPFSVPTKISRCRPMRWRASSSTAPRRSCG